MAIQVQSPGWRVRSGTRGRLNAESALLGLPEFCLTDQSRVAEEVVLDQAPATRGLAEAAGPLDVTVDVEPGQTALLAIRHPSGALTFHRPVETTTSRGTRGPSAVRFQVTMRREATRGFIGKAVKAIVIKVAKFAADKAVGFVLPKLVAAFEKHTWSKRGLKEGWFQVTQETLAASTLAARTPVSPERTLLFIHGTYSNAGTAFHSLTKSGFFDRAKSIYDDRIFAFNHFSLLRTPEENAVALLEGLPEQTTTFDVITHSRGGLVLRTIIERADALKGLSKRFKLGRAVLVASPNSGTPLATPARWENTVGWLANLLEMFPDNPFTIGGEFVANGLVWLANHASGDIPGLHAMDADGEPIQQLREGSEPPAQAYSALVANYHPTGSTLKRLVDIGLDQFFGTANDLVVPTEGGWQVARASKLFIPSARIGCFGAGGNLRGDSVTHTNLFAQPETTDFLLNALEGRPQALVSVDPRKSLPDRRLGRGAAPEELAVAASVSTPAPAAERRRERAAAPPRPALSVSVMNGDLTYEPAVLMLGHYASTELTGTEAVMNRLIGWTMDYSLKLGLYPLAPGSHQIFVNKQLDRERGTFIPRPRAVVVVGLGAEGNLQAADLVMTVRLAIVAWARRLAEGAGRTPATFELASTLIGSGGTGMSAGQSAQLITQGVIEANALLEGETGSSKLRWPRCASLRLVELYLDRATEAWRALQLQEDVHPDQFVLDEAVLEGKGGLIRPPESGYRGADYDFITVKTTRGDAGRQTFEYTLDTRRARSEVRGQQAQSQLLNELVTTASNDQNRDPRIGRTLSNLLVPLELEPYLAASGGIQISLDPTSAALPWELLDVNRSDATDQAPWAIRVKLLRKLQLQSFRQHVVDADANASVLVVGEPLCPDDYPRLPGARFEAERVHKDLTRADALDPARVKLLVGATPATQGPDAQTVINALFERTWRIVHIAGHGIPGDKKSAGGVVLSSGTFLGPDEIRSMRVVPELVFVNCCYLGAMGEKSAPRRYDRVGFASGVAGALIDIGVRCVVAAGWAVDDDAASDFASTFYDALLRGWRFIDAVGEARSMAYSRHPGINTWAAYQCYGDPDWRLRTRPADANQAAAASDPFAGIASSPALKLELKRNYVQTRFQNADRRGQINALQQLEKRFARRWGHLGSIAEAFGRAYTEAGDMVAATQWYERALKAADGSAPIRAAEQLGNVMSRAAWESVEKAVHHRDEMARQQATASTSAKGAGAARKARTAARAARRDADRRLRDAVAAGKVLVSTALKQLSDLARSKPTMERLSLVAGAIKRRALINFAAGQSAQAEQDLAAMKDAYERALEAGRSEPDADLFYPATNILSADVLLRANAKRPATLDKTLLGVVTKRLKEKSGANADFWSVVADIELTQAKAIAARRLDTPRQLASLKQAYARLYERARAAHMWASVYDSAYLMLQGYGQAGTRRATGATPTRRQKAAQELLALLRQFAHPDEN